ncbi:sporulation and spore germination protein [Aminivibrio pyruvatiphilus]|uniref:Sporulation and spore germination protein n=1 Tax=Aminivibrio pyruvatiphilus TaxID=1005740 RepID=A0A4R8M0Z3_9BACT|nr:GerMN domain-containing protein [Aminivibrio pyruvatiphilus]TDY54999.1 sporulation and spore germination protein [Aminivibrio pyruvatiphilus]
MPRKYDDYDDGFEVRRREAEQEEPLSFREERRPVRRRRAEEPETKKAPLLIRIIAWLAVVAFCFVAGYVGTSLALRMLDKKDILMRKDVASDRQEAQGVLEGGSTEIRVNARKVAFSVYFPREGAIVSEKTDILSGIMEDDIRQVFGKIISLVPGRFSPDMKVLNVFRSGDTLFLNLNASFISSLAKLGAKESTLFITAVVRTITENFPPLTKVRFLINGKVASEGAPVDLTVPWQLPQ